MAWCARWSQNGSDANNDKDDDDGDDSSGDVRATTTPCYDHYHSNY